MQTCDRCGVQSEELIGDQWTDPKWYCPACYGKLTGIIADQEANILGELCQSCGERHQSGPCPDIPTDEDPEVFSYA